MSMSSAARLPAPEAAKVYSYTRWSTPEQAKGDSSRRQTEAAAKWAARNGLELDESLAITDEGVSAFRGSNALDGGLSRFLEACRKGLIEPGSFLLVESLDRISRMPPRRAQRLIDDIVDNGVTIVTLSDDQHYTADRLDNDPTALLIALMVSWRSHEESKTKGRRVAAAWAEKRRAVRADPSVRLTRRGPSWLLPTPEGGWAFDESKVATVRRIYSLTLAGFGEHRIAALFNAEGTPVLSKGRHWRRSTVSKVLRSPAVLGILVPGHIEHVDGKRVHVLEQPVPGAFPAVIDEADWLAVRALKDGTTGTVRGRHAEKGVAHLFAGLAKCPVCEGAMTRVSKGSRGKAGRPKLVCCSAKSKAGCNYVSVKIEEVEAAFWSGWGNLYADVPAGDAYGELDRRHRELEGSILGAEDLLQELMDAVEGAPSVTGASRVAKIEAELRLLRSEIDELEERRHMADRGLIRSRLDRLYELLTSDEEVDRTEANASLKVLFRAVTVDYRTGHLRLLWRQGGETEIKYAWVD